MRPGDFLLGVMDFFAVLLPGALAMWLVAQYAPPDIARNLLPGGGDGDAIVRWTVFLLGSYVLGHFVFMAGSNLDPVYDRWRRRRKPRNSDRAYRAADELRKRLTPELTVPEQPRDHSSRVEGAPGPKQTTPEAPRIEFTTLKWAKCYIQIHSPHARVEIDRIEANSKFFRGMVVMSLALVAHFLIGEHLIVGVAASVMGVLSFVRYCDQRWKSTELSYGTAVVLNETKVAGGIRANARFLAADDDDRTIEE